MLPNPEMAPDLPEFDPETGVALSELPERNWVSDHAVKRIRKRLGVPKKAAQREAERALDGAKISDFVGQFRRHLDWLRHRHGVGATYRVTSNAIFAFQYGDLATVLPIPAQYRNTVNAQLKRMENSEFLPASASA
ncbi:hypothetical protein [Salipiger sp. CCB-MM3]|uniref:hypothetical protein n=1 Tax=Salipiger sp. CCB-MM3 TaxID=1792508 RepID=UPI0012F9328B|nr:hypothetical protein [Salipiger sp. CCB-MM3]